MNASCLPETEAVSKGRQSLDIELAQRVKSGDQSAFRIVVERYQARIFSVIYRVLRNHQDAEDTAQRVFTKAYFAINSFDCRCSLLTWIYKIAINESYSHLRHRRVRQALESESLENESIGPDSSFSVSREPSAATRAAARDFLNKLLMSIPEEDRLLLILKEVQGHSVRELADLTGATENAIKIRMFRARRKLQQAGERLAERPIQQSNQTLATSR